MADSRKLIKVFLASPGDLQEERKVAKAVTDEFNALLAEEFGYQVELVGWEDTVTAFGRPQAIINRDLERCELFVGMMWRHWGTPPDVGGTFTSGFEEEYEISYGRRLKEGRPEINLLFKEIDESLLRDPGDALKKVLAFKERLVAQKSVLFETFSDVREFEKKFRRCLTTYVRAVRARELQEASRLSQSPTPESSDQHNTPTSDGQRETLLSNEGASFLRAFVSKTERDPERNPITNVEVARVRLLAGIAQRDGNDEHVLGVHDANLIYARGQDFKLGRPELEGLFQSGLAYFSQENAPLWRWLTTSDGLKTDLLSAHTIIGSSMQVRIGALDAMRLISEPIPTESLSEREEYLDYWFERSTTTHLKIAALRYLAERGIASDLKHIRKEFDKNDNQTAGPAADASIRINLRNSRESAIAVLYDLQPTSTSSRLLQALFARSAEFSTEKLLGGIAHRDSEVRHLVTQALRARDELPNELAEKLLTDSSAQVRYEALDSLVEKGRSFSVAQAKDILVKPKSGWGILGGMDTQGEESLRKFTQKRLHSLTIEELQAAVSEASIFDQDAYFVLVERQFKRRSAELRESIDDQFKGRVTRLLQDFADKFGGDTETLEKTRSLEEHFRKKFTREGLDIIARKSRKEDLGRVRVALKSGYIGYSPLDVEYIQTFGEWDDIPLVVESLNRSTGRISDLLIGAGNASKYETAAKAILELSGTRLAEVLKMEMPSELVAQIVATTPDKTFRGLDDASIMLLFRSKSERVRKNAAVKCVRSWPKRRLEKILQSYISGNDFRYYNVVHWLDFAVSVPKDRTLPAAEKILKGRDI